MRSLVLTVIGEDRPGLVERVSEVVKDHDGSWQESRMVRLGGRCAGVVRVSRQEARVEGLEAARQRHTRGVAVDYQQAWTLIRYVHEGVDEVSVRPAGDIRLLAVYPPVVPVGHGRRWRRSVIGLGKAEARALFARQQRLKVAFPQPAVRSREHAGTGTEHQVLIRCVARAQGISDDGQIQRSGLGAAEFGWLGHREETGFLRGSDNLCPGGRVYARIDWQQMALGERVGLFSQLELLVGQ